MLIIDKEGAIEGGVYAIVDIVNWEVYIGETGALKGRADNYRRDLERRSGEVNEKLQKSYDMHRPLLWFSILCGNVKKQFDSTDNYRKLESFYIALMDEIGFLLYNDKQKQMTMDKLIGKYGLDTDITFLIENARLELNKEFENRFGYDCNLLKEMSCEEREEIWEKFLEIVKHDIKQNGQKSVYRISDK